MQAPCALRGADGRTVGGSADDHILFFPIAADCGTERRHSSSWSWRAKRWSSRFSSQTAQLASQERISERIVDQIVDSRVVGGGLQDFRPGQSSSSSSSSAGVHGFADELGEGVFRTFPRQKKSAKVGPHSGSALSADFTPSTPTAYFSEDGFFFHEDDTKVWLKMETGRWKLLCSEPAVYRDGSLGFGCLFLVA